MVRLLYTLSFCALLATGGTLALAVSAWRQDDPVAGGTWGRSSAIEAFKQSAGRAGECPEQRPPLIVQAEALAQYLNPPKGPERPLAPVSTATPVSAPVLPRIRPMAPSANFKLRATSYYPNQPAKSMALIAETGSAEGSERWVKEGSQVGRFVIQEIRRGSITYRDGSEVRCVGGSATMRPVREDGEPDQDGVLRPVDLRRRRHLRSVLVCPQ